MADVIGTWPEKVNLSIWIKSEGDGAYGAIVEQFDIVGQGKDPVEARTNAVELTLAYLNSLMKEGAVYDDAVRPIPRRLKLRLHAEALMSKLPAVSMPNVQMVAGAEDLPHEQIPAHC